jgi:hypothetical protein
MCVRAIDYLVERERITKWYMTLFRRLIMYGRNVEEKAGHLNSKQIL